MLRTEKLAILALAVKGAGRIIKNGRYSIPQWMIDETDQSFRDADSVTEWLEDGGLEKLFRYQEKISFNEAFRAFHEEIKDRGPREWVPPFSNFRTMVRAYVDNDPELEIVRLREGYKIRRRLLV